MESAFDRAAWEREVDAWHAERMERLRSEDGWLALAGRWELHPGPNDLPLGTVWLDGPEGAQTGRFADRVLRPDEDVVFEAGRRRWEVVRSGGAVVVRLRDPNRSERLTFPDIHRFPLDPRWRTVASIDAARAQPLRLDYARAAGVVRDSPGPLSFTLEGRALTLQATLEPSGRLFVLFADDTQADETYPAGRFLYASPVGDRVVLDFNRAFNPPCALTEFASCPLVPPGNRLSLRIEAGEKRP
jgi:uncharacterized protein (DUF1684 family)